MENVDEDYLNNITMTLRNEIDVGTEEDMEFEQEVQPSRSRTRQIKRPRWFKDFHFD
jgi:hypothetical protein